MDSASHTPSQSSMSSSKPSACGAPAAAPAAASYGPSHTQAVELCMHADNLFRNSVHRDGQ